MDIKRCFEILELEPDASLDKVKQAYKDIINVWHPDRFSHNPRLMQKAEKKVKEINTAYETAKSFFESKQKKPSLAENENKFGRANWDGSKTQDRNRSDDMSQQYKYGTGAETRDKTEQVVELGTGIVLSVWSYLSKTIRNVFEEQIQSFKREISPKQDPNALHRRKGQGRGMRKGMGMGRGMGMGKGKGRRGK